MVRCVCLLTRPFLQLAAWHALVAAFDRPTSSELLFPAINVNDCEFKFDNVHVLVTEIDLYLHIAGLHGGRFSKWKTSLDISYRQFRHSGSHDEAQSPMGNTGCFANEIDMAGLKKLEGIKVENVKPQVDRFSYIDGHGVELASGRLQNLGCATGHPSFVMPFTSQVLAQRGILKNWKGTKAYKNVYLLPKELDEANCTCIEVPELAASPITCLPSLTF